MSMEEGDLNYAHQGIKWNGYTGQVNYDDPSKMVVLFYNKPVPDPQKSTEAGRPHFKSVVYVRYHAPGERLNINDRPATREHMQRWPVQYQQFLQNREQIPDGTPIDLLFPNDPSIGATLRANAVHTIEQCADLSTNAIDTIGMGCQNWVNAAKRYLEAANKGVGISQMQRELDKRDQKLSAQEHEMNLLKGEIKRLNEIIEGRAGGGAVPGGVAAPGLDMNQLAALVAAQMGKMPNPAAPFDAQTAQINANSATAQVTDAAGKKSRKAKKGQQG